MEIYYSPLRFPGGKSCLLNYLSKIIGLNNPIETYIEPFAGGAGAALGLLYNGLVERIVINDFDEFIYKFWNAVLNDTEALIQKIKEAPISVKEWKRHRLLLNDIELKRKASDLDIGFSAFYLNRCNRSGIVRREVGPIGGIQQLSQWKIGARFNKEGLIKRIKKVVSFKEKIQIFNLDAIDFLRNYCSKKNKDRTKTLVYLDPPYFANGPKLYRTFYDEQDHTELQNFLKNELDIRWVLSYDDVEFINKLYEGTNKNGVLMNHFANKAKVGRELIISSDNCKLP